MNNKKNFNSILRTIETKKDKDLAIMQLMRRELPAHAEKTKLFAQYKKISFDAYVKEGFTPEQALELCKDNA